MGEQEFWNGKERFFSDIINRVNDLLSDAYLLITNRNSHVTMIPEKTAAFFEMQAGYVKDFYQILLDHVHPDDRPEYLQAMEKRLLGQKLSDELYIRLKNKDHYDMFGFFMSVVKEDGNEYLLHILVNQNVIPEIDALIAVTNVDEMTVFQGKRAVKIPHAAIGTADKMLFDGKEYEMLLNASSIMPQGGKTENKN